MNESSKRHALAWVVVGVAVVALVVTPAAAHFRPKIGHLFKHFRAKADPRYVNVDEAVGARLLRTTQQSIPDDDNFHAVSFDSEAFDTGGMHDSANPTRLTAPRDGAYLVTGTADFFVNPNGARVFEIRENGATVLVSDTVYPDDTDAVISTVAPLLAGDYVELRVKQDSGGSLNLATGFSPLMTMQWLGPV